MALSPGSSPRTIWINPETPAVVLSERFQSWFTRAKDPRVNAPHPQAEGWQCGRQHVRTPRRS
ncbi:hypothetical protein E5D57_001003 [Metarhizium anisopliae]|nr:hypothetical protein E5D57_001003 [Metarhizium anisopliae]